MLWSRSSRTNKESARDDVTASVRALLTDPAADVRNRAIAATARHRRPAGDPRPDRAGRTSPSRGSRPVWRWRRCRTSALLQVYLRGLTEKNADLRKASAARDRQPFAIRRPWCSTSSRSATSCRRRCCPSSGRSSPAWCPSRPGMCWDRFRSTAGPSLGADEPIDLSAELRGSRRQARDLAEPRSAVDS